MTDTHFYPVGIPGQPWSEEERNQWRARQTRRRAYREDVVPRVEALAARYEKVTYGQLDYAGERYPLFALRSRAFEPALPAVLVTGGVHGYETSGVHGALQFLDAHAADYADRINLLVAPCISPWGYEHIQRWNPSAIDPNRSFREPSPARESAALIALVAPVRDKVLMHIDLHETTDTDETEFRPTLAARDGKVFEPGSIPDGFYLVDDLESPQPGFQQAIIEAVSRVTHIAPPDERGQMIGSQVVAPGVIRYPFRQLSLCAGVTDARYRTTTEVYPDSPHATPAQCNDAQVAAVRAAIDYALAHR